MKLRKLVLFLFLLIGVLYFTGSFFDLPAIYLLANLLMIPIALFYYGLKSTSLFWPIVVSMLLLYVRDLFLFFGFYRNPWIIMGSFVTAIILLLLTVITGFQRSKIHFVEIISLVIMFGFLGFLGYSIGEMIPEVIPSFTTGTFVYMVLLLLLVGLAFTRYLLKSHWASLWFLVGSASLLVSELSYFFKTHILADLSVRLFHPVFHVLAIYAFVQFAVQRRKTARLPYF